MCFLFSCAPSNNPGKTRPIYNNLTILSGEYLEDVKILVNKLYYPKNGCLQADLWLQKNLPYSDDIFVDSLSIMYAIKVNGNIFGLTQFNYLPYGALERETHITPWCEKHIDDFSKIDLVEILTPKEASLSYMYLHIKSLKIYSTNQEIAGRPIGADLSDLFCYVKHPKLYSYPDLSESIPDYKSDPEKLTLARLVELNMLPQVTSHFVLPVEMTKEERQTVNFKIEMVVEDDVLGERDLSAELTQ